MAYKSKGPSMKQGGTFMSKHNSSYMHKQNLLNDMPVDDHASSPLNINKQRKEKAFIRKATKVFKNPDAKSSQRKANAAARKYQKHLAEPGETITNVAGVSVSPANKKNDIIIPKDKSSKDLIVAKPKKKRMMKKELKCKEGYVKNAKGECVKPVKQQSLYKTQPYKH